MDVARLWEPRGQTDAEPQDHEAEQEGRKLEPRAGVGTGSVEPQGVASPFSDLHRV